MIVLGDEYQFLESEIAVLEKNFKRIDYISLDTESIEKEIQNILSKTEKKVILLNSSINPINKNLVSFLTNLELEGTKFFTLSKFTEKFLHKIYIPYDNHDLSYLQDIKGFNSSKYIQKRIIDYLITIPMLIFSFPLWIISAIKIQKESKGNIFFKQLRVGKSKKEFYCLKFRSMHENSHFDKYTRENDSRIFPWGNKMRKTRIDELPQLVNVLKGDMHIIGPRAEWNILVKEYEQEFPFYNERHIIKPGITGLAQVMYPYGQNLEDTRQKLMYDLYYIKNWSLLLEIKTIFKTINVVLGKKGM
jgi:lipopolysaccharide/colanic/teichoic acid biosynthesis glycosyltransferase